MEKVIERIMATDFLDFAVTILNQPHSEEVKLLEEVSIFLVLRLFLNIKLWFIISAAFQLIFVVSIAVLNSLSS